MPRDIPVGNGQMLVNFDPHYRVRDLYFPHVGQENHAGGTPCRFGVWAPLPPESIHDGERRRQRLYWSDDGWDIRFGYRPQTLATDVHLHHPTLRLDLHCCDVVDFHRPVLVRRIEVTNHSDHPRQVSLFHHHDFQMYGVKMGDTAYFDPQLRCLVHYRQSRYITAAFYLDGEQQIDEYATGTAGFGGAEGTFRDAEDGKLGMNPISQGAVDSTMSINVHLRPGETRTLYMAIIAGKSRDEVADLHAWLTRQTPATVVKRTTSYWRLWSQGTGIQFGDLSENVQRLFKRSLLTVRTQIDDGGAILAANDSDIMQFARDTYSYMWPRDGALVADALDLCGYQDLAR
ncbi:MAG: glycoside hydrolase family 15 protein, partial [Phycisphaeraceae bacterium]